MATNVRIIIFNIEAEYASTLRSTFLQYDGVRIAAELDQAEIVSQKLTQIPAEVLLINLDPDPERLLKLAGRLATEFPDLAIFATSESRDGQLILGLMRKGIREFFPKPIEPEVVQEALDKISLQRAEAPPNGRLITMLSGSGGQGATMLVANLAVELADLTGGRIAVVDLDYRFGQLATHLDVEPNYTLADLCNTVEHVEQSVIEKVLVEHDSGVKVLCRPNNLDQTESLTASSCLGVLSTLLQFQDYVIVDGPTRFDVSARAVLDLADVNLLLAQCLVPSVRNTVRILDGMRDAGYNMSRLKVVCNRVGRDSSHLSVQDVISTLNLEEAAQIPDDWSTVGGAVNLGVPLLTYSPKSKVRLAVRELAERLHAPPEATDQKSENRKGLMSRIFA